MEKRNKERERPPLHSLTHTKASSRLEIFMKRVSALAIASLSYTPTCCLVYYAAMQDYRAPCWKMTELQGGGGGRRRMTTILN
jgi:hypothetical protein